MKFDVGNSVLLGNMLGQVDDLKDSSRIFYNNWYERQQQFVLQQLNSSSQQPKYQISQINSPLIPNHNSILQSNSTQKSINKYHHHQSFQLNNFSDYNNMRKKTENGFQIASTIQNPCKMCSINKSICQLCTQKQIKNQKSFNSPKDSESFQTNNPLSRQQHSLDQGKMNTFLLSNNQLINQQSIPKRNEIKKLSVTIDPQNKQNGNNASKQAYKQDGLKLKLMKYMQPIEYHQLSTIEKDKELIQPTTTLQQTLPSTEEKIESTRRQYFSEHSEQTTAADEKILNDNYMKYILGIKQEEGDYKQIEQKQNQDIQQFKSNKLNQLHQLEKNCVKNIMPIQVGQNKVSNQKNNNPILLNKNNIKINLNNNQFDNNAKQIDQNPKLVKQKSNSQHVNPQLVIDVNQIKIINSINATNMSLGGRNELINKKNLKYELYIKDIDNKSKNINYEQNAILGEAQSIKDFQNKIRSSKKSVIYSKIKQSNLQGSPILSSKNNTTLQIKKNDSKISPQNQQTDSSLIKNSNTLPVQNTNNEYYQIPNVRSLSKNEEYQSNISLPNNQQDNTRIVEEKDINDSIEEEYNSTYLVSGKKKKVSDQFQKYVQQLKRKAYQQTKETFLNKDILSQDKQQNKDILYTKEAFQNKDTIQSQDSIIYQDLENNNTNQYSTLQQNHISFNKNEQILSTQNLQFSTSEKDNKRGSSYDSSKAKIPSLSQKSTDQNAFNFNYRKTMLRAQTNFNNSDHNQSVEQYKQDNLEYNENWELQKNNQERKISKAEFVQNHTALPISFPILQGSAKKKNIYLFQNHLRNDLQLHAQKIQIPSRIDKQSSFDDKEGLISRQLNKKYHDGQDKFYKLQQNTLPISSYTQIKTESSMNELDDSKIYKKKSFLNKDRISLQDISLQDKLFVRKINEIQQQDYLRQKSVTVNNQRSSKDTIEWKNNPPNQLTNHEERLLIEKALVGYDEINANRQKNKKIIKTKGYVQQQKYL